MIGAAMPVLAADLPQDVADTLLYMREEEKLAHDVYVHFAGLYVGVAPGAHVFDRIAESEQRHTDAIRDLLATYGIDDPAAATAPGEFVDDELQALYFTLTSVGEAGITEALGVGVLIEQKDMTDIVAAIEVSAAYSDIVQVYTNLLAASQRHLDAFMKVLDTSAASAAFTDEANPGKGPGKGL
jgi:hypothetical protein